MSSQVFQKVKEIRGKFKLEFFFLIVFLFLLAVLLSLLIVLITTFSVADTTPPVIAIISPQNITYLTSSVPLTFVVSEPTYWIGYNLNNQANVTISGNTSLTGLVNGCHSVVVYGNDSCGNMGASGRVYFTVAVNHPPTAPVVDVAPEVPCTVDDLVCAIISGSIDPDGDPVTYTYEWYKNDTPTGLTTDTVSHSETSKEETWKCVVRPNDGTKEGPTGEDSATIVNSPPAASNIRITPSVPFTDDDLTGSYNFSDADEDEESGTEIIWYKNENPQSTYNDMLTVPYTATSEGEEWYFTVRPKDGTDFGNLAKSNVVTIKKMPTYTLRVNSSPHGVTFTVDGDSHTTPWLGTFDQDASVNIEMPSTAMIGEAKYFWSIWSDEETDRCRTVTLNKNINLTGQFSGPYYELMVASSPITGITFTIDGVDKTTPYTEWLPEGSYTLVMPETYDEYVWSHWLEDRDTNRTKTITLPGTTCTGIYTQDTVPPSINIISPQNNTYVTSSVPLTFFLNESTSWIGYSLDSEANVTIVGNTSLTGLVNGCHSVVVYGNDSCGNMGASGRVYFTVAVNHPPTAPVVDVAPEVPCTVDDLVCAIISGSIDPDGDPVTYRYEWLKDGELQRTVNTTELTDVLSSALTGKTEVWKCVVTPNDGEIDGPSGEDQVVVQNSPPEAYDLAVTPAAPDTTDSLDASYIYMDADDDSESGTEISWYKDGVLQSAYSNFKTLPFNATCRGEEWYFTVRPKDGVDFGDLKTSPSLIIQNAPPSKPVVKICPDSPKTTDDLTCNISLSSVDPDGDSVTYKYEWYKDDVLQPELNTNIVSSALTVKCQVWKCIVTPNDGVADGSSGEDSATIVNSPPTCPVVDVTPDSPDTTDELICTVISPSYDPDGDTIIYRYDWYKNCVWQLTGETVLQLLTNKGETWKCIVTPNDGTEDGPPGKDLVTISCETTVYVDPQENAVKIGQTFKVNVSIADVSGLQGFDFCLSYDTTILDCLEVEEGPFMASSGPTIIAKSEIDDRYNEFQGRVWMAVVIYGNSSANGRGTLATITFNATATGEGSLDLHSILPYNADAVKLSTCHAKAISNKAVDGYFEVLCDPKDPPRYLDLNEEGTVNVVNMATMTAAYGTSKTKLDCSPRRLPA